MVYATSLTAPAVAIPVSLPWMTDDPYAAYARVRARRASGAVTGSAPDKGAAPVSAPPPPEPSLTSLPALTGAPVDLWDSGRPTGRLYWTVVPVLVNVASTKSAILSSGGAAGSSSITVGSLGTIAKGSTLVIGTGQCAEMALVDSTSGSTVTLTSPLSSSHGGGETAAQGTRVEYRDVQLPQDACTSGRVLPFGKQSEPVVACGSAAYVSGLSPTGRLVASVSPRSSFFGSPLVAWQPALGADTYQVEWSRASYPWKAAGSRTTQSTSALLPLDAGRWFYRVRGVNALLSGSTKAMSWSAPRQLTLAKPKFRLIASSK